MANRSPNPDDRSQAAGPEGAKTASGRGDQQQQQGSQPAAGRPQIEVDDSKAIATYANFCRVSGTPEELIVDFGLNPQPMGVPRQPIVINQRIILNHYTAKRLLGALQMSIQRHEAAFGVLETDVQKRLQPAARAAGNARG